MTLKYYEEYLHWIWRQFKDSYRRQENIGFQNFVVTYWPSSWLRPCSLRGAVSWSWISNASLTLRSNLRSSVFRILVSSHLNPALQFSAWKGIPEASHFSSVTVFWCCEIRDCTLSLSFVNIRKLINKT